MLLGGQRITVLQAAQRRKLFKWVVQYGVWWYVQCGVFICSSRVFQKVLDFYTKSHVAERGSVVQVVWWSRSQDSIGFKTA